MDQNPSVPCQQHIKKRTERRALLQSLQVKWQDESPHMKTRKKKKTNKEAMKKTTE